MSHWQAVLIFLAGAFSLPAVLVVFTALLGLIGWWRERRDSAFEDEHRRFPSPTSLPPRNR